VPGVDPVAPQTAAVRLAQGKRAASSLDRLQRECAGLRSLCPQKVAHVARPSSRCADSSSARSFSRLRLVVVTIADFRSPLAGGGEVTARSRSASPGVLGCAAPS
jgi:hypothetical protein